MNPFDFFQHKSVLTCDDMEWCQFQNEAARVGLGDYQKFGALPDIGPHQSFSKSARQILIDFHESDSQTLLHLEDDCVFRDLSHLGQALSELPEDWDIVYLGANLMLWGDSPQPERYSEHLFRIKAAWTTHAIGYNKKVVQYIVENQPHLNEMMFDTYLGTILPKLNAFVVAPMVAYQRPHVSAIWQRGVVDDYTEIFEASDARLI